MVSWDDRHQGLAQHDLRVQESGIERRSGQADVQLSAPDAVDLGAGDSLRQQHLNVREGVADPAQQWSQDGDRRDSGEAEPHHAGGAGIDAAGKVTSAVDEVEKPVCLVQEGLPSTRQLNLAIVAREQDSARQPSRASGSGG